VSLEIGKSDTGGLRFALTASGTIKVIKLGNLASGAATFVLQTGDSLADTELWGVAAFSTNFDFLHTYGVDLQGHALLQINTTDHAKIERLSLEGIPGGVITSFAVAPGNLTTDRYNPVALTSGWNSLFSTGQVGGTTLTIGTGQRFTLENYNPFTPASGTIEGISLDATGAVNEWRIKTSDKRQWWIDKTTDASGADLYLFRGEQRTYTLAAQSFSVEIEGGIKIYDVSNPTSVYTQLGGGFLMRIQPNRFEDVPHRGRHHHRRDRRQGHRSPDHRHERHTRTGRHDRDTRRGGPARLRDRRRQQHHRAQRRAMVACRTSATS